MIDQAMIMAAGLGTRLRPFTALAPKPLLPLLGYPLLQWVLTQARAQGVRRSVANFHHLPELFRRHAPGLSPAGMELVLSDESQQLLGSAGGIARAREHFEGRPFFLMNADVIVEADLEALAARHENARKKFGATLTLALHRCSRPGAKYRQIQVDEGSRRVIALGELGESVPFYAGVAVIEPEAVAHLDPEKPSEFVPEVLAPAVAAGKVAYEWLADDAIWEDIGEPKLWWAAHERALTAWQDGRLPAYWRSLVESRYQLSGARCALPRSVVPSAGALSANGASLWDGEGVLSRLEPGWFIYGGLSESELASASGRKLIAYQGTARSFD